MRFRAMDKVRQNVEQGDRMTKAEEQQVCLSLCLSWFLNPLALVLLAGGDRERERERVEIQNKQWRK